MSVLARDADTPAFIALPLGAAAAFVLTVTCGPGRIVPAVVLLSVVVFVAGFSSTAPAAVGVAGIAWLCLIGFVVVGGGVLRFHAADGTRLALLVGIAAGGWFADAVASAARRRYHRELTEPYPQMPCPASIPCQG